MLGTLNRLNIEQRPEFHTQNYTQKIKMLMILNVCTIKSNT